MQAHDDPELRREARSLLYPAKRDEGVDAQGRKWIEQNTYWADGTVERVLWRENDGGTWTPFSSCPRCGSVNGCACRREADRNAIAD